MQLSILNITYAGARAHWNSVNFPGDSESQTRGVPKMFGLQSCPPNFRAHRTTSSACVVRWLLAKKTISFYRIYIYIYMYEKNILTTRLCPRPTRLSRNSYVIHTYIPRARLFDTYTKPCAAQRTTCWRALSTFALFAPRLSVCVRFFCRVFFLSPVLCGVLVCVLAFAGVHRRRVAWFVWSLVSINSGLVVRHFLCIYIYTNCRAGAGPAVVHVVDAVVIT